MLDAYLSTRTFLVAHTVSLADIIGACTVKNGMCLLFEADFRSSFPHVVRWFLTCVNQPNFNKVMGDIKLCEKTMEPPKADRAIPAAAAKKEVKKEGKKEAKKEAKPKETKPKEVVEEAPAAEVPAPKAKNPLDLLPPSPMVLDAWKRLYSNTPAR